MAGVLSDAEFHELVQEVKDAVEKTRQVADTVLHQGDRALSFLSRLGAINKGDAESIIKELARHIDELWYVCSKFLVIEPGMPWRLYYDAAASWTKVGGGASALAAEANAGTLQAVNLWEGPAAYTYWLAITPQNSALLAIKSISDEITNSLTNIAIGIVALWAALLGALVVYLAELCVEATATATVVAAPVAVPAAGASTLKVIGTITVLTGAFGTYMYMLLSEYQDLLTQLNSNAAFPKGHWPVPQADMSDASVTDGDSSDWRIRV